ncbi:MAG TPA: response regulator [Candidatus Bathyarchaeia archaeon]
MGDNPRILVIDDDENIRKMLTAILEDEGYTAESVGTAKKAIEKTKKSFYNLALIDIRLPDMDGIKLLTKVRETTPKMRKIIITGYPTLQNAIEAVNKGADAYIIKPFDMRKVLKAIKNQLARQAKEKDYSQEKVTEFIEARVKELSVNKPKSKKP